MARLLVAALLLWPFMENGPPAAAQTHVAEGVGITPALSEILVGAGSDQRIPVIVTLRTQALLRVDHLADRQDRRVAVVEALRATAAADQAPIRAYLERARRAGRVRDITPFWVFNGLAISATPDLITALAERPDVARIAPNATFAAPAPSALALAAVETNLAWVGAPALWSGGYRGQGVVVANMDTGVDLYHPDLYGRWRGGANSWFDPYGEHPTVPTDLNGHGTETLGVLVGGAAGGTAIGMAPDARWIAVKAFNDRNTATVAAIHAGFQWLLDPDGNPGTPDAPDVVSGSWGYLAPGCDLEYALDIQALRAAGILPVFSAGNLGPSVGSSASPANNPGALAVGATDGVDGIYYYSSRGPSACGGGLFPALVAPGVTIRTADRHGGYTVATGTSLAAPHVAGALALLLSAFPGLTPSEQEAALLAGVVDLGLLGPDATYGHGRLDVAASYDALVLDWGLTPAPTPEPSPAPSASSTPLPTVTPRATAPLPTLPPPTATPTTTLAPPPPTTVIYLALVSKGAGMAPRP